MTCGRFDIGLALFPFTDRKGAKFRPFVTLTSSEFLAEHGHVCAAMITTASVTQWASDLKIKEPASAGLKSQSVIRFKLFTLQRELVAGVIGRLGEHDQNALIKQLRVIFP